MRKKYIIIGVVVASLAGYYGYTKLFGAPAATRYVTAAVSRGTLTVSVTGSGQVSAVSQIEVKPKASGDVAFINVTEGQSVAAGTLLMKLDARDAEKAVRDAQVNLDSAKLQLEKLRGADATAVPRNKLQAQNDLAKAYDDGYNDVANSFLDLPAIVTGLHDVLFSDNFTKGEWNMDYFVDRIKIYDEGIAQFRDDARGKYQSARAAYDESFDRYKAASRFESADATAALIDNTYVAARSVADAVKSANNLLQFYKDKLIENNLKQEALVDTYIATLNDYTSKTNTHLTALLNIRQSIIDGKDAVSNADLDVASQVLAVRQRANALADANEKLADYYIRAPFDGVVAKIVPQRGDAVSSGGSVATFITARKYAEVSLNEVDVAAVKTGEKAALTFDAIPDLSISGVVSSVDTIGTVTQGVVTYNVKIGFDTQDTRVKAGMSASAAIITDVIADALLAPNSAVKVEGEEKYVQVLVNGAPERRVVETGIANDTMTVMTGGVVEGEEVVTQTITGATAAPAQTQSNSTFRFPGIGGGASRGR